MSFESLPIDRGNTISTVLNALSLSGRRCGIDDVHDGTTDRLRRHRTDLYRPKEPQRQSRRGGAAQMRGSGIGYRSELGSPNRISDRTRIPKPDILDIVSARAKNMRNEEGHSQQRPYR